MSRGWGWDWGRNNDKFSQDLSFMTEADWAMRKVVDGER